MSFDATTLGVLALVVAIAGVLATLVAPSLGAKSKVYYRIEPTSPLTKAVPGNDIQIVVRHDGNTIDAPVFTYSISIGNSGRKDLVAADFVDPIRIFGDDQIVFLSADTTAPDGVAPEIRLTDGNVYLSWRILKPREKVVIRGVLTADRVLDAEKITKKIGVIARLRDVSVGKPDRFRSRLTAGMLLATAMSLIVIPALTYNGVIDRDYLSVGTGSNQRVLVPRDDKYILCYPLQNGQIWTNCHRVTPSQFSSLRPQLGIARAKIGIPLRTTLMVLAGTFAYILTGALLGLAIPSIFNRFAGPDEE